MSNTFQCISPVDGQVYIERPWATDKAIHRAIEQAAKAQKAWRLIDLDTRIAICNKALDYFLQHTEAIAKELSWQMGRPIRYTPFEITKGFEERARYMTSLAPQQLSDRPVEEQVGFQRFIRREPLGTVLVLAPWNYPYLTSVNVIWPALLAGNAVILKHALQTPLCAERYAAAFEAAGLPPGLFQYLHASHEQVAKMIGAEGIDYVAFTGSVSGGKAIQKAVGERFIATGLELGGKDPAYVRADANLDQAVENLVDGAFFNSGQSCCGIERIYVGASLYPAFVEAFVDLTKSYQLGNPLDEAMTLGPMVRSSSAVFVENQIQEARSKGARALIDPLGFPAHREGSPYKAPQVMVDVNHQMSLMQEESFGPVVGIMSVKNDEEAIRWMNDSRYGLTASVWSKDLERAIEIGQQLETGTFFMNRCDYLDPALAWTGVKDSGRGCTLSAMGFDALTRPKSFHLKMG
ncbi:MAG: aldehyde dehydrogenase family protein [Bacteroidota bacterium]